MQRRPNILKIIFAFAIVIFYCVTRFFIYLAIPIKSFPDWFFLDAVMDAPRFIGFLFCLAVGYRYWGQKKLGFHAQGLIIALIAGIFMCVLEVVTCSLYSLPFSVPTRTIILFYISSFFVGLFEEVLFRGVLLNALHDWKGNFCAVWLSSLIFMSYHIQAQPLDSWPAVLFIGLLFAMLRIYQNVSLYWLIVIHGIHDSIFGFIARTGHSNFPEWASLKLVIWALSLLAYYGFVVRKEPGLLRPILKKRMQ